MTSSGPPPTRAHSAVEPRLRDLAGSTPPAAPGHAARPGRPTIPGHRSPRAHSLGQQSLGGFAEEEVPAAEPRNQLVVALRRQIDRRHVRRLAVSQSVEPPAEPVDAGRVADGVLRAVVAVVPVQHVEAAIRSEFQGDRHEPVVVGGQEVRLSFGEVGRAVAARGGRR